MSYKKRKHVSGTGRAGDRHEIWNQVVRENPRRATTEQRIHDGEGMSLRDMPPSHPLPTVPFPSVFIVRHLRTQDRIKLNAVVGSSWHYYQLPSMRPSIKCSWMTDDPILQHSFPILCPTLFAGPSSHLWQREVWSSSQWWRHRVDPSRHSWRDMQNRSVVPRPQIQHSRTQITEKTGQPPRTRWWLLVQQCTWPLHQPECTCQLSASCQHPRSPSLECSDEPQVSQTHLSVSAATCGWASDETGEKTDATS